jgi:hypothetical protein
MHNAAMTDRYDDDRDDVPEEPKQPAFVLMRFEHLPPEVAELYQQVRAEAERVVRPSLLERLQVATQN